jgi:cytochrome c
MPPFKPILIAGLVLMTAACGKSGGAAPDTAADATAKAAVAALPAPYNTADIAHGKALFAQCRSCHTAVEGGANMVGPNLYGVFGRVAGSKADFNYSPAVKAAGFTWDAAHLDSWLKDPRGYLPGAKMTFAGLENEKDRIDVIAYLKTVTGYKP